MRPQLFPVLLALTVLVHLSASSACFAAVPPDIHRPPGSPADIYEQRQRMLEEEQRRSLLTPPESAVPPRPQEAPPERAGACANISAIHVEGATLLSRRRIEAITRPHEGKCLTLADINGILREITNAYTDKGYITSRALLEPQDLSTGELRIRVIEGRVESIEPDESSTMQPRQFLTIFPFVRGEALNLRDIEQGLDQLNRLPSNRAAMRIEPGEEMGYSKVIISNRQERAWRPQIGVDNLGQDTTGRAQLSLGLEKDNLIGCNDQFAVYYTGGMPQVFGKFKNDWEGFSDSVTAMFSVPFGYWLLSGNASVFNYTTQLKGVIEEYTSNGTTVGARLALDRVLWRDADSKLSLGGWIQYRNVNNYIQDERLLSSSYRLATAGFSAGYVRRMLGGVLSLSLEHGWGLPHMSWAIPYDSAASAPKTNFAKTSASVYWNYPFNMLGQDFSWTLSARGQLAQETLYSSERMYLGGFYTVRGFKNSALGGNSGGYARNELAWRLPRTWLPFEKHLADTAQVFAAYDMGGIIRNNKDPYERGHVNGMSLGFRTGGALAFEFSWAHPLYAPGYAGKLEDVWSASLRYTF